MSKNKAVEHVYLPNEVFHELQTNIENSRQIAFAYSYLYYITYLYRYCKYIDGDGEKVTQERIKEYLGYSPKNKKVDYIVKKNGLLDNLNYTKTTTDYPIQYFFDENDILSFDTIDKYKDTIKNINDRNFKIKIPLKGFYRSHTDVLDNLLTGTFYEVENTHRVDFGRFESILKNPKLGVVGFLIYGYLKHKNDIFTKGYQRSFEKIGLDLNMSEKTVRKYIDLLEENVFIKVERKSFKFHSDSDTYEANIYNIL